MNTVELMRAASAGLGIGPHHAMSVAERLYTQGYISYPRTETTHYSENFDLVWVIYLRVSTLRDNLSDVRFLLQRGIKYIQEQQRIRSVRQPDSERRCQSTEKGKRRWRPSTYHADESRYVHRIGRRQLEDLRLYCSPLLGNRKRIFALPRDYSIPVFLLKSCFLAAISRLQVHKHNDDVRSGRGNVYFRRRYCHRSGLHTRHAVASGGEE